MAQSSEFQLQDKQAGKVTDKHDAGPRRDNGNGINLLSLTEQNKSALIPGDHKEVFNQNGNRREFDIHIPKNYDGRSELAQAPAWAKAAGDNMVTQTHTPAEDDTIYTGGSGPVEQIIRLKHKEADGVTRGGEHAWDGGNGGWSESRPDLITWISKGVRKPDPEFDASHKVVDFFLDHPKH